MAVLCQSLDALTAVHGIGITHRDIKPENILLESRDPFYIKLSDFGLSNDTDKLKTFCGTHLYAAPEIYLPLNDNDFYTNAADIWSLGVVIFKCAYGFPDFHEGYQGLYWCHKIMERLNSRDAELIDFLETAMVIIEPKRRHSARDCWKRALQLSAPSESRCAIPTRASYTSDWATPSATEAATFINMEALQNHNPGMQGTSSQATVDHYLINYDEEQQVENQGSLTNPSTEVSMYLPSLSCAIQNEIKAMSLS